MLQEKDYLLREVERITLFLKTLLRKVAGLKDKDFKPEYEQLELDLKNEFDFSLSDLIGLNQKEFETKLKGLHESHIDILARIFYELASNLDVENNIEFAQTSLCLIEMLDKNSRTFSFQRQKMRDNLKERLGN